MTEFTKSHEIALFVTASTRERDDVMDLLGRHQLALLPALLSKGMVFDVSVADSFPRTVVAFVHDHLMLGAVFLTNSEPTAAGVYTGASDYLRGIRKALAGLLPRRLSVFCFLINNDTKISRSPSINLTLHFQKSINFC